MQILKHMLKDREENQANILAKRLDRLWTKKQKEKETKIRKLRYEHIKSICDLPHLSASIGLRTLFTR